MWLKNWNSLIEDYEEKCRANLLLTHHDNEAEKIIGLENEHEKAIEKLDNYYGDTRWFRPVQQR